MQKTVALALLAASIVAFPVATPSFAYDASKSALCGPDAPDGYKRPGGYCESITENKSLIDGDDGCTPYVPASFVVATSAKPVLVAEYCYDGELPLLKAV